MKIDVHTHILPEKLPKFSQQFGYGGWIQLKHLDRFDNNGRQQSVMMYDDGVTIFRNVDERVYSPEARIKDMNNAGINLQVISTVPVMFNYWSKCEDNEIVARYLNDHIASVVNRWPDRFIGLGTVPMQNALLAVKEMIRCKDELHLNGIIIGTHVKDLSLDNAKFEPFWKAVNDLEMPVFIHPWDVCQANNRWSKYFLSYIVGMTGETTATALTLALSGILERYRKIRIILSHGGGTLPYVSARANKAFQVYPDAMQTNVKLSPDQYLKHSLNICSDTLVHNEKVFNLALDYFGPDSLLLGSDYPFLLGEDISGTLVENSNISTIVKEKILYKNAARILNIEEYF